MTNEQVIEILKGYKQRLENVCSNLLYEDIQAFDLAIKQLKERPQGEWITKNEYTHDCSLCGCSMLDEWNFCPNCGADMRTNFQRYRDEQLKDPEFRKAYEDAKAELEEEMRKAQEAENEQATD